MLSIQEMLLKTEDSRKALKEYMNAEDVFHPGEASVLSGLGKADYLEVKETLRAVSLADLIQEFLGKSGTTGIAGAAYLIPDKVHDVLFEAGAMSDIVPRVANIVTCPGSSLKVDIEVDDSFKAHFRGGGGDDRTETMRTTVATATPKLFSIAPAIDNELIEDSQFDMFEVHLRRAAEQMGQFATEYFLADLITCADGDGTQNAGTSATANKTYLGDLAEAWNGNAQDKHVSDQVVCGPEVITDILQDATVSVYGQRFHDRAVTDSPLSWGSFMGMNMNMVLMNEAYTGQGALYLGSKWTSFILRKETAMLAVRKRWMKIEEYSNPLHDLVGAVISARQDQVSVYNDASYQLTES